MFRTIFASALALGTMSGAASAADLGWDSPTYDWTGLYIGAFGGGISGAVTPPSGSGSGPSGFDAGLSLGYSWQPSNFVFTPFIAVPIAGQSGTWGSIPVHLDWAVVGGVKIGYATGRWQPYAFVAGVTGAGTATPGLKESHQHTGVTFGVGAEYAVSDRWSIGLRYAHVSMNQQSYFSSGPYGWEGNSIAATVNFKLK